MNVEILDTTLRDGEQTSGVSFSASEKLSIVRLLLEELHIPRIEIASARVSDGEFEAVRNVCAWAKRMGHIDKLEVLGFIDNGLSINWVKSVGAKVINLLSKGSEKHCLYQLKKTPQEHFQSRGGIPLWTKVMRKEARHTQMRDRASGVHPDVLEHVPPPKKPESAYCIALCSHL